MWVNSDSKGGFMDNSSWTYVFAVGLVVLEMELIAVDIMGSFCS